MFHSRLSSQIVFESLLEFRIHTRARIISRRTAGLKDRGKMTRAQGARNCSRRNLIFHSGSLELILGGKNAENTNYSRSRGAVEFRERCFRFAMKYFIDSRRWYGECFARETWLPTREPPPGKVSRDIHSALDASFGKLESLSSDRGRVTSRRPAPGQ